METPYRKNIMRHALAPRNRGLLKNATCRLGGANPSCGDSLEISLRLDKQRVIKEVGWEGFGCTISLAGASILSELILGKKFSTLRRMKSETYIKKLGIALSPTRLKCALLALYTLKQEDIDDVLYH